MKVRDLMRSPVHSCSSKDTADRALNLMWEHDVGSIVVIDSEAGLVGMITDRDIAMAAHLRNQRPAEMPVVSIVGARVYCCAPDDTIAQAEQTMAAHQIRRLPVVADGLVVGMLSTNDLVRAASGGWRQYKASSVVETLASIAAPRRSVLDDSAGEVMGLDALRQLRDELRVQIHLARADALDEWEKAEAKWHRVHSQLSMSETGAKKVAKDATATWRELVREMTDSYKRVRNAIRETSHDA